MELLARRLIRDIPDFPKAGIVFKDITPVVQNAGAFRQVVDRMKEYGRAQAPDAVVGIESRGFIFGAPLALELGCAFVPVRKLGKLTALALEYSRRNAPPGRPDNDKPLIALSGGTKVPFLVDADRGAYLFGPHKIIAHLEEQYGRR